MRRGVIVNVTRNADKLAPGGVCLMLAQDFGDARDFAGADEQIDFRQFGGEFVRIALGEASGDNEFFYLSRFFESRHIEDGIDGFFFSGADKAASIYQDNVSELGLAHHFEIVLVQQPGHDFGIDQVTGASQTDNVEFLFGLAHCPSSTTSAPFGICASNNESFNPTPLRIAEKRTVVRLLAASRTLTETISKDVLLTPRRISVNPPASPSGSRRKTY